MDTMWNLGLVRVQGSLPAEKCVDIIYKKLMDFKLNMNDIVSVTTDGASVMVKLGKIINAEHQLCLAHGTQLAIIEVLYKASGPDSTDGDSLPEIDSDATDGIEERDSDDYSDTDDEDDNDCMEIDYNNEDHLNNEKFTILSHKQIHPIVSKIREVVRKFRRSPTKN